MPRLSSLIALASLLSFVVGAGLILGGSVESVDERPARPRLIEEANPEEADPWLFPIEVLLSRAERLLDRTNRESTDRAAELYGFALKIDPASSEALRGRARTSIIRYARRWEPDEALLESALVDARRAAAIRGDDARSQAVLAFALLAHDDLEGSFDAADEAWKLRDDETPTWVDAIYAQTLLARWDREAALSVIDDAVRRRPDRAALHALRGAALIELERYGEAIPSLQRARLLEPDLAPALLRLGFARERMGDRAGAATIYEMVSREHPEEKGRAYILMAVSLIAIGDYDRALAGLASISLPAERGLGEGTRLYLVGLCHEKAGRTDLAREAYERVVKEHPLASFGSPTGGSASVAAYEALARIALSEERLPEAARLLEEALQLKLPSVEVFLKLARVYEEHGLPDEAAHVLARGARTEFGTRLAGPKLQIFLAWARLLGGLKAPPARDGKAEALDALAAHGGAIEATGNEAWFLDAARASLLLGSPDGALGWLRKAVALGYRQLDWIPADAEMKSIERHPGYATLLSTPPGS